MQNTIFQTIINRLNFIESKLNNNFQNININKHTIGLSNIDNTSDINKPISNQMQNELNKKAPIDSPTFNRVNIGTNVQIENTAILQLNSTSQGFLPPRMTKSNRDMIKNPVAGLIIWCIDAKEKVGELQIYEGSRWINMLGSDV